MTSCKTVCRTESLPVWYKGQTGSINYDAISFWYQAQRSTICFHTIFTVNITMMSFALVVNPIIHLGPRPSSVASNNVRLKESYGYCRTKLKDNSIHSLTLNWPRGWKLGMVGSHFLWLWILVQQFYVMLNQQMTAAIQWTTQPCWLQFECTYTARCAVLHRLQTIWDTRPSAWGWRAFVTHEAWHTL